MRRLLLINNPAASGFTGGRFRSVLDILGRGFAVTPSWPNGSVEAQRIAAEAAREGYDVVVAMGGDGVVHHVANGLIGGGTALGVIPAGTTNVLARILGFAKRPEKAAVQLLDADPEWSATAHYVVEPSGGGTPRTGHATFAVGVGFDAEVVAAAETQPHSKLHFGSLHYARTTAAKLFSGYKHKPATLRVECEGHRVDAVSVMVAAHSPYTYFGAVPLRLTPGKEDGLVAIAIERLGPWRAIDVLTRAIAGRPLEHRDVHVWRDFGKLIIEADPPIAIQADGEGMGTMNAAEIAPAPSSLLVLRPRP